MVSPIPPPAPPPDPFQLATSLIRHARELLDEIRNSDRGKADGMAELQSEIEKLNTENAALRSRMDELESKLPPA